MANIGTTPTRGAAIPLYSARRPWKTEVVNILVTILVTLLVTILVTKLSHHHHSFTISLSQQNNTE